MADALSELTGGLFHAESLQLATKGKLTGLPPHGRTRIRDYVVEILRGVALDGDRVEASRALPVNDSDLPRILVYFTNELAEPYNLGAPTTLLRIGELVTELVAGDYIFLDRYGDNIANVIEHLLMTDPGLGGHAVDTSLIRTEITFSDQEAIHLALFRIVFAVRYLSQHAELVPDDLLSIRARMDFAPADQQIDAETIVTLPPTEGP